MVLFLLWMFGKKTQRGNRMDSRTFRRRINLFWHYWALPPIHEERETVIHVDGLSLNRNVVVLIASGEQGLIRWYLVHSESSHARLLCSGVSPPRIGHH